MRPITLAKKDLALLWRDKSAMFWVLVFPLLIGILFGSIFGGNGEGASKIKLAVIDQDGSKESAAFVKDLSQSTAVKLVDGKLETAREQVRKGDLAAYLLIPKGYGLASQEFRLTDVPLKLGIDPARSAEAGMLQGVVTEAAFKGISSRFSNPAEMQTSVQDSLKRLDSATGMTAAEKDNLRTFLNELNRFSKQGSQDGSGLRGGFQGPSIQTESISASGAQPASSFEVTFPQALVWGLLGVVTTFAISMVRERQQGTLVRLRTSPMSFSEILLGKGVACFLACLGVMAFLLFAGFLLFHIRIHLPQVAVALVSSAFCFVGIMMLLSVLGKTEQSVAGSSWGVLIICAMFGGGMIPVFMMPSWMQTFSGFSPLKWSTLAMEGAIWRGFTMQEMLLPVAVLLGVGAVCFAAGVRVLAKARE